MYALAHSPRPRYRKLIPATAICRFAEPIALTSVWPYVPELMERFGVPENEIARWAGLTSAVFSICQAFTGLIWGAASDHYGRKPIILLGLFNTMCTMLLWGFSTNLPMAMAARALQGLGNGNVGILRTTVAELCPWKELQPRAFSIMPLVYTVGAIFGPTLGGALSNPLRIDPRAPRGDGLLERFPYCLPNIVAAVFFAVGIVVGWLFLQESLESKKGHQDLGLRTGAKITGFVRRVLRLGGNKEAREPEREPLLGQQKVVNGSPTAVDATITTKKPEKPKIRDVLTYQTTLNLVVYTHLSLYSVSYDQVSILTGLNLHELTIHSLYRSSCTTPHKTSTTHLSAYHSSLLAASASIRAASVPCSPSSLFPQLSSSSCFSLLSRATLGC